MILQHLINSASELNYREYTSIGFVMGTMSSLLTSHLLDITMAFVIGASGALGAALVKYVVDKIKKRNDVKEINENIESFDDQSDDCKN